MDSMPINVYSIEAMSFEDRYDVYSCEMLHGVRCNDVQAAILTYVIQNIEPVGWKAIWRRRFTQTSSSLNRNHDVLVEVQDVSQCDLEATVKLLKRIQTSNNEDDEEDEEENVEIENGDDVVFMSGSKVVAVSLLDLFPIHEDAVDDEQFERTAEIIEHLRFFYKYLWYPWDSEDEENCVFVGRYLKPRLTLYYDVLNGILPSHVSDRYYSILNESRTIRGRLDSLEVTMDASDSEVELNERDVMTCMTLRRKLDEFKNELQTFECPALRSLIIKKELDVKSAPLGRRSDGEVVFHVVADKLIAGMFQTLDSNTVVEHHKSFGSAITAAYEGDSIYVYPGIYRCEALGWLDDSITIEGKGTSVEDVVIEGCGSGDIFLNCSAPKVSLLNLTIRSSRGQQCPIMIHNGETVLSNCSIEGGVNCIGVGFGADATITDCRISGASGCGIHIRAETKVILSRTSISGCDKFGVAAEYVEGDGDCDVDYSYDGCHFYDNEISDIVRYPTKYDLCDVVSGAVDPIEEPAVKYLNGYREQNDSQNSQ